MKEEQLNWVCGISAVPLLTPQLTLLGPLCLQLFLRVNKRMIMYEVDVLSASGYPCSTLLRPRRSVPLLIVQCAYCHQ